MYYYCYSLDNQTIIILTNIREIMNIVVVQVPMYVRLEHGMDTHRTIDT